MDIEYAVLADFAEIVGGKLYLMGGGWDTTSATTAPAQVRIAVAVGIRIDWTELGKALPVVITVEDDDGQEYVRIEGAVTANRAANAVEGASQLSQMAANVAVALPNFGGYRVHIRADDQLERRLPFRMVQVQGG